MASKSRSAAAKKAWATRRKLYGKSGVGKKSNPIKLAKHGHKSVSKILKSSTRKAIKGLRNPTKKDFSSKAKRMAYMTKLFGRPPSK